MPVVAVIAGVQIMVFYNDHDPPHVHAEIGEHHARVSIATGQIVNGDLPAAKRGIVIDWAQAHRAQLSAAWTDARQGRKPRRIE